MELDYLQNFKSKTAQLRTLNPNLVKSFEGQIVNSLRLAFASSLGQIFLAKAIHLFRECAPEEKEETIASCVDQAQAFWSQNVMKSLGANWPEQTEALFKNSAGKEVMESRMKEIADFELSKIRTFAALKNCYKKELRLENNADSGHCEGKVRAECQFTACNEIMELALIQISVERCEAQAAASLRSSSDLASNWWMFDSAGGWKVQSQLIRDFAASFNNPCLIRNSSKAFNLYNQTLQNIAVLAQHRAQCISAITSVLFIISVLTGSTILVLHYLCRESKNEHSNMKFVKVICGHH